jgi:hypothetical protein
VEDATHHLVIDIREVPTRIATAEPLYIVISARREKHGKLDYAKKAAQQAIVLATASENVFQTARASGVAEAKTAKWLSDWRVVRAEIRIDLVATIAVAHDANVATSAVLPDLPEDSETASVTATSATSVHARVVTGAAAHHRMTGTNQAAHQQEIVRTTGPTDACAIVISMPATGTVRGIEKTSAIVTWPGEVPASTTVTATAIATEIDSALAAQASVNATDPASTAVPRSAQQSAVEVASVIGTGNVIENASENVNLLAEEGRTEHAIVAVRGNHTKSVSDLEHRRRRPKVRLRHSRMAMLVRRRRRVLLLLRRSLQVALKRRLISRRARRSGRWPLMMPVRRKRARLRLLRRK